MTPEGAVGSCEAPAKVNLSLHVTGRRDDGYHLIEGLVTFAGFGDRLRLEPARGDCVSVSGPFVAGVPTGPDNLVLRALGLAREIGLEAGVEIGPRHIHIDKRLPVAAGIGGGSADAAAVLRLVAEGEPALAAPIARRAVSLGADVPMCLHRRSVRVSGIGEETRALSLPPLPMVLVNPGVPLSTPAVFKALRSRENPPPPPAQAITTVAALIRHLHECRNDLETAALSLAPVIGEALGALKASGAGLARMSGSGATVFGLFETESGAANAARIIAERHPDWWVVPTQAGDPTP